jgi:hypothetical protein
LIHRNVAQTFSVGDDIVASFVDQDVVVSKVSLTKRQKWVKERLLTHSEKYVMNKECDTKTGTCDTRERVCRFCLVRMDGDCLVNKLNLAVQSRSTGNVSSGCPLEY